MSKRPKKPAALTPATKKAGRYANLVAHAEAHPKDAQSQKHLNHSKWADYR